MINALLLLNSGWVLLFTRLVLGSVMLHFGWPKIKSLKSNSKDFVKMGLKPGILWGTIVAIVEFAGGAMMVLGIFAEFAAILFGIEMIGGAIWKITKTDKPFSDWSYDLVLLSMCLVIIAFGAGFYAFLPLF